MAEYLKICECPCCGERFKLEKEELYSFWLAYEEIKAEELKKEILEAISETCRRKYGLSEEDISDAADRMVEDISENECDFEWCTDDSPFDGGLRDYLVPYLV